MVWKASDAGFRLRFTVNGTKDLPVRGWICPMCGVVYGWDVNARKEYPEKSLCLLVQPEHIRQDGTHPN